MALQSTPAVMFQPANEQVALPTNYITNFDFLNQYLPDVYEREFARYGDRTLASFLRYTSSEIPSDSDLIKWSEDGRLHVKYTDCESDGAITDNTATITVNDTLVPGNGGIAIRKGQTVMLYANNGSGASKAIVTDVDLQAGEFDVAYYAASGQAFALGTPLSVFIYGSEFKKGTTGMEGFNEAQPDIYQNSPTIKKDNYTVAGSDMAQIGWINVSGEGAGVDGYYWYLKSKHETRLRFDDYLETSALEDVPAEALSGAATQVAYDKAGNKGSEGVFYVVGSRGNVWGAGHPTAMADWDVILKRLDKQGTIQENCIFMNRDFSLDTDDVLASQNSYGAGGTSYGLFNNDENMALNLGFKGFHRGSYQFYKTDWKYLNDPQARGGMPANLGSGRIDGMLVPCGTKSVYDNVYGQRVSLPFIHVRYRKSPSEDRKYKTWITGSAGGATNSDLDAMQVNFLSERCTVTLGANNFMLFES